MDNSHQEAALEIINIRLGLIEDSIKTLSKHVDELVLQRQYDKGVQDTRTTMVTWLSKHGLSIFSVIMAIGVVIWEFKKAKA